MKKLIILFTCMMIVAIFSNVSVKASQLNFSVNTVIPDNQQDKDKSYFDIKLLPKEQQDLKVVLKNSTDKLVVVEASINRATTNLNGVVEYGKVKDKKDSSLINDIEDYVTVEPKEVSIEPNSETEVTVKVTAPNDLYEGIMAGGLTFKEKAVNSDKQEDNTDKGLAIENEYAYIVGLVIHGDNENISSLVTLNDVIAAQINSRNVINANIQNPKAKYINQLSVDAKITKKGSSDILYQSKSSDMQMAPNSNFNYPIHLDGQPLKPGKYTIKMDVQSNSDKWELSKDFEIEKKIADSYNAQDVTLAKDNSSLYLIIALLIAIFISMLLFFIYKKKKKEKELAIRRRKRKKKKAIQNKKANEKRKKYEKEKNIN